jgi:hypothetical protein
MTEFVVTSVEALAEALNTVPVTLNAAQELLDSGVVRLAADVWGEGYQAGWQDRASRGGLTPNPYREQP